MARPDSKTTLRIANRLLQKPWLGHYDAQVPAEIRLPKVTVDQLLDTAAQRWPERLCAVVPGGRSFTYGEINHMSRQVAGALVRWGLKKGERVALIMPNVPEFVAAYYGILKAGGVVVATNPMYRAREMEFQLSNSGARLAIVYAAAWDALNAALLKTRVEQVVIFDPEERIALEAGMMGWAEFLENSAYDSAPAVSISAEDAAIFQYTGGTTGVPKAAIGLHRNLVANTVQFRTWLHSLQEGNEVVLASIPLYHVYGMVIAMNLGIMLGAQLVLIADPRNTAGVLQAIQDYRATIFPGVPNMYQAINQNPDVLAGKYDLSSIRACISGSAPLLRQTKETFERLTGGKLLEGYGLSEAPTATHCNPLWGENRTGSIGLPLPGVEARIVSLEDGIMAMRPTEIGELIIRSPQVMAEYYAMPEETRLALRDGWLYTGDIAWMDTDGYFYLVDRKKDVIKIGGFQVWPREVEEVIGQMPGVKEVAVAGVQDPLRGERVKAWVVLQPAQEKTVEEIRIWCDERMTRYKVPTWVEFITSLPRSGVGKVLRRELVRQHHENHPVD